MNKNNFKIRARGKIFARGLPNYLQIWRLPPLKSVGPQQFADLFRITPIATLGQIVNATIVAIALCGQAGYMPMFVWWLVNLIMCGWTFNRWLNNRHRKIEKISRRAVPRAVMSAILYALPWALLAGFYLGSLPHHEELIMSIAVIGMVASGSVQLSRIYPAAIAYLVTIFTPVIIKSITIGEIHYYLLAGLAVSYIGYLLTIVANSANTSIERSTALSDLEMKVMQLDEANDSLEQLASFDDLTDLPNRRAFYTHLDGTINEAMLLGDQFTCWWGTWTTSKTSTTWQAMPPVITCCKLLPNVSQRAWMKEIWWPEWAVMSLR